MSQQCSTCATALRRPVRQVPTVYTLQLAATHKVYLSLYGLFQCTLTTRPSSKQHAKDMMMCATTWNSLSVQEVEADIPVHQPLDESTLLSLVHTNLPQKVLETLGYERKHSHTVLKMHNPAHTPLCLEICTQKHNSLIVHKCTCHNYCPA